MAKKKRFKDMSPPEQRLAIAAIAVSLGIVAAAERDLQRRPASEVRGEKWIWRVLCLNALGALAYFGWGRSAERDFSARFVTIS